MNGTTEYIDILEPIKTMALLIIVMAIGWKILDYFMFKVKKK